MTYSERIPNRTKNGFIPVPDRIGVFNRKQYSSVLATDDKGQPYTSLISYAITPDLKRVIFATPKDTRKYCLHLAFRVFI